MRSKLKLAVLLPLALALLCASVHAGSAGAPPLPDRNPARVKAPAKPVPPGEAPSVPWTEAEIAEAKKACEALLAGEALDYETLPPIKEGLCGAPAPVLLRAAGSDPKVTIEPPATVRCELADKIGAWLRDDVQPEAKRLFGSAVAKIRNATSYACRNRYGGEAAPLSEHALANALDVSEFVLANGTSITVLRAWPKPLAAAVTAAPPAAAESEAKAGKQAARAGKTEAAKPDDKAKKQDARAGKWAADTKPEKPEETPRPTLTASDRVDATPAKETVKAKTERKRAAEPTTPADATPSAKPTETEPAEVKPAETTRAGEARPEDRIRALPAQGGLQALRHCAGP